MNIKDKIYITIMYIYNSLFAKTLYKKNIYKWFINNWDNSILIDYPLDENSIVVDVWWYIGVFSDKIVSKYNCKIYIFEPVKKYYEILKDKYEDNKKIHIFHFGLWNKNDELSITIDWERSSVFTEKKDEEKIIIKPFHEVFKEQKINKVDLISMNIEWWEYDLIDNIIDNDIIKKIDFLQIQFHDFVDNADSKRTKSIKKITKTHIINYSYPFVWESFTRK